MIGFLTGEVVFSDGHELVLLTGSGVGYQLHYHHVLAEGTRASLYVSHVVKETSEELFGFEHLRAKKLFELLLSVRGVGPKSAYALMSSLEVQQIIEAIQGESKKLLTQAPGVGDKAASQMILDLSKKIHKIRMYSSRKPKSAISATGPITVQPANSFLGHDEEPELLSENHQTDQKLLDEALLACRELGFKDEKVIPLAQRVMSENFLTKPEQLVHLVLKEI